MPYMDAPSVSSRKKVALIAGQSGSHPPSLDHADIICQRILSSISFGGRYRDHLRRIVQQLVQERLDTFLSACQKDQEAGGEPSWEFFDILIEEVYGNQNKEEYISVESRILEQLYKYVEYQKKQTPFQQELEKIQAQLNPILKKPVQSLTEAEHIMALLLQYQSLWLETHPNMSHRVFPGSTGHCRYQHLFTYLTSKKAAQDAIKDEASAEILEELIEAITDNPWIRAQFSKNQMDRLHAAASEALEEETPAAPPSSPCFASVMQRPCSIQARAEATDVTAYYNVASWY
jgi:hypothetical protein